MPPLERLNELLKVVEIPPDKYGVWSGLVWQVSRRGPARAGSVAGTLRTHSRLPRRRDWYVRVDGLTYLASRIIYYMMHGEDLGNIQVDHKDQNTLNNNKWNLRLDVAGDIQKANVPMLRNNTSGVRGVSWHKLGGKWMARAEIKGKQTYLGLFVCKIEAARVVNAKWTELGWHKLGRKLNDLEAIECNCGSCKRKTEF